VTIDDRIPQARESFDRHAWNDAYVRLAAADAGCSLASEDLERTEERAMIRPEPRE